ncbi:MAG TPA: redox-regulated ATPase YchF [Solirubrobacterales bacterium]|nr:redox-regulated ATPase YchF [Solirubrobacterales bacterium]
MKVGIVGLPNAGKTTLFNALTRSAAETAVYPFTTVDENVAVVEVPDDRLEPVATAAQAAPVVFETIEFHDIAGLVRGASEGEGLGNRFLAAIRETDAICHVVRAHSDQGVPHPEGDVEPARDIEIVEAELRQADLETARRRLERVTKQAHSGDKEAIAERDWLEEVVAALGGAEATRSIDAPEAAAQAPARLQALTSKPVLYVANVDEGEAEVPDAIAARAAEAGAAAVAVSARIESELAELDDAEAAEMRAELDLTESGLERLVAAAYDLLGLITFFTAHEGVEARARSLPRGATAWDAAGKVHSDIQAGFVRAEVIGWRELIEAGGYAAARERGVLRTEGRDYVVADGDVVTIRH